MQDFLFLTFRQKHKTVPLFGGFEAETVQVYAGMRREAGNSTATTAIK